MLENCFTSCEHNEIAVLELDEKFRSSNWAMSSVVLISSFPNSEVHVAASPDEEPSTG